MYREDSSINLSIAQCRQEEDIAARNDGISPTLPPHHPQTAPIKT